jgi:transposase InsO family protein
LAPRTLRHWQHDVQQERRVMALGRPTARASRLDRQGLLEILKELGPGVGVPTLRACCPALARAEIAEIVRRYRRVWRWRHQEAVHVLHWPEPGPVWAIDYAEPPVPIDGVYRALLAVRDLASGCQLLWLPVAAPTAKEVVNALTSLFVGYGAPLVLKSDNGSPFSAGSLRARLGAFGVTALFSPPGMPRYNGAAEAGICSLKTRTETHAACQGRPGWWTWDDVASARAEANATARPRGPLGPSPKELWNQRRLITLDERSGFQAAVARHYLQERQDNSLPREGLLLDRQEAILQRCATRRALEEQGYLLYSRRRIQPPIRRQKEARIT